jgi:hypothetical protein
VVLLVVVSDAKEILTTFLETCFASPATSLLPLLTPSTPSHAWRLANG